MIKFCKKIFLILTIFAFVSGMIFAQETADDITEPAIEAEAEAETFSVPAEAQKKLPSNHEIYLGYGYFPGSYNTYLMQALTSLVSFGLLSGDAQRYGIIQAGYNWYFWKGMFLGGTLLFEPYKIVGDDSVNIYSTAIHAKWGYQYGWEYVRLYHGLSLGLNMIFLDSGDVAPLFSMNIIPIGVKFGKEQGLNGFLDVGFGSTTFLNAGASYRF